MASATSSSTQRPTSSPKWGWMIAAVAALLIVLLIPMPAALPVAGHRALAILAFAVILWVSEAVSYPVSAFLIVALISLLLGFGPNPDKPAAILGTKGALSMALAGFSNSANALVAGALFLAVAMQVTGLDKRIALVILSKVGSKTKAILAGSILVGIVMALLIPSTTARVGAVVPIMLGIVSAFGLSANSQLSALLIITAAQAASIWNIGIKTAAAQNMVALGFMDKAFASNVSWGQWFMYSAPWAIIMSVVLYFVMLRVVPPEFEEVEGGRELVQKQLAELGPMKPAEIRLLIISLVLLFLWATENVVHPMDTTTTTLVAVAVMLTPGVGVMNWKEAQAKVPWGTIMLFAVGISLGTVLLKTQAAGWLANAFVDTFGLRTMPMLGIVALLALFNIVIHLGFASATSLSSTLIPIVIALMQSINRPDINAPGMVLVQQFVVSFGFLLPVSAPQNMLAYGTGAFTSKQFLRSGIPLTLIGYALILLFASTYWKWVGLL